MRYFNMKQKHHFYRKEKNHLNKSLLWKEIMLYKAYDFSPVFFLQMYFPPGSGEGAYDEGKPLHGFSCWKTLLSDWLPEHFPEGWREPGTYRSGLWKCGLADLPLPGQECSPVLTERHNG